MYPNMALPQLSRPATAADSAHSSRVLSREPSRGSVPGDELESPEASESGGVEWRGMKEALAASLEEAKSVAAQKQRLQDHLAMWGFQERPVPEDNNCQFHAIADQLAQTGVRGEDALSLRIKICEWLRANGTREMDHSGLGMRTTLADAVLGTSDEATWDVYVSQMCLHNEIWGDEATLLAAATLFEAEVMVISSLSQVVRVISPPEHWAVRKCRHLYVGHYHEYHYVSVAPSAPDV